LRIVNISLRFSAACSRTDIFGDTDDETALSRDSGGESTGS
jgi:hypothetical protein